MLTKNLYITVAGVMGSGKTTASKLLAKEFNFLHFEENPSENFFLKSFYDEPERWAFHVQSFYLHERSLQLTRIKDLLAENGVVQDSPIFQDYLTYARAQKILGYMTENEFSLYERFFHTFSQNLPVPDVIVQLDASLPKVKERIHRRARSYEKKIDDSYLELLIQLQKEWLKNHTQSKILVVDTDNLNIPDNAEDQPRFIDLVSAHISPLPTIASA